MEPAEMHDNRLEHRRRRRTIFTRCAIALTCLAFVPLAVWGFSLSPEYWTAAWEQRSLLPTTAALSPRTSGATTVQEFRGPAAFDLEKANVPVDEIHSGGPPKDGIPALTNPEFIAGNQASYLGPSDRVIGVVAGSEARAYPLRILNYHEIVNDRIGQLSIAVTYCPLCDSAAVFDRRTPLGEREFGVSGLLYNSNVLLYDRGTFPIRS